MIVYPVVRIMFLEERRYYRYFVFFSAFRGTPYQRLFGVFGRQWATPGKIIEEAAYTGLIACCDFYRTLICTRGGDLTIVGRDFVHVR